MKLPIINQKYVRNADVTSTTELVIGIAKQPAPRSRYFSILFYFSALQPTKNKVIC